MNEKITTPDQVVSESETSSLFKDKIFERQFKDGEKTRQCFLIKSSEYHIEDFDKATFKIISVNQSRQQPEGIVSVEHSNDERHAIEKFKIRVFEAFQRIDFLQVYIPDLLTSESERLVFFIKNDRVEWKFSAILEKSNQTDKS